MLVKGQLHVSHRSPVVIDPCPVKQTNPETDLFESCLWLTCNGSGLSATCFGVVDKCVFQKVFQKHSVPGIPAVSQVFQKQSKRQKHFRCCKMLKEVFQRLAKDVFKGCSESIPKVCCNCIHMWLCSNWAAAAAVIFLLCCSWCMRHETQKSPAEQA